MYDHKVNVPLYLQQVENSQPLEVAGVRHALLVPPDVFPPCFQSDTKGTDTKQPRSKRRSCHSGERFFP